MGVAIEGPKGYEYQYKVTVLVSLIYNRHKVELYVEKDGSEDALLILNNGLSTLRIEIQVKREEGNLEMPKLIEWLSHFQERRSDMNLLETLFSNRIDLVLFVTRSRCSDDIVPIRSDIKNIETRRRINVSTGYRARFTKYLSALQFGKTKLMRDRRKFCQAQASAIKTNVKLGATLSRILVWEESTEEKIDTLILESLNKQHQIAQSNAQKVYLKLLEIVKSERNSNANIQDKIQAEIQINKIGRPIVDPLYKSRPEERKATEALLREGVLLLTGSSLCGKSELAKQIALNLFDKGYDYFRTNDPSELVRFLSTNSSDNKIAILEDPWGHLTLSQGHQLLTRDVQELISNNQGHHKIIITTTVGLLFEIFKTEKLNECRIKGFDWFDLTIRDKQVLNKFWLDLSTVPKLPTEVIEIISVNLLASNDPYPLQIGQLRYLAAKETEDLMFKNYQELEHIAREASREIADAINQKDSYYSEVLAAIAMCSTPLVGVNRLDLAYILRQGDDQISIIDKGKSSPFDRGEIQYPKYADSLDLPEKAEEAIQYLEERQLIRIYKDQILFSHPNYYEAGRFSFFPVGKTRQKKSLKYFLKSISCLNPMTAFLATKQYSFINNRVHVELKPELIKIAFQGLNSIFPAVEDNSLVFLTNNISSISDEDANRLINLIQRGGTDSSYIVWYNDDIPFISGEPSLRNMFVAIDKLRVNSAEEKLAANRLPGSYDGWMFIESLKDGRGVPKDYFNILLNYNETFIRKRVVFEFFRRLIDDGTEIVQRIFKDEHPSVVFDAIRASFIFWTKLNPALKVLLADQIKASLAKDQIAIRASNLISTFATHYASEGIYTLDELDNEQKKEIWTLWGSLYPIAVANLPAGGIFFNTARFGATMDEAIKYMDVHTGMGVLNAWFKRIDHQITNGQVLDEFEMAIADHLMELTDDNYEIRNVLFTKLLTYTNTSFTLSNIKWIVPYWEKLHSSEKQQILNLIQSHRVDLRWIKAVLLTLEAPPEEIVFQITGVKNLFNQNVEHILTQIPSNLLRDCLNVFCGFPQPLWWLAVHHRNKEFWHRIMRHILVNENHEGFDICLQEFLGWGVNGFSDMWDDPEKLWRDICFRATNKKVLAESLIFNIANCSCNIPSAASLWATLKGSYSAANKSDEVAQLIVENIEILQQTGHKEDLIEIFEWDYLRKTIIPKLIPDGIIIGLMDTFGNELNEDFDETIRLLQDRHIRFFLTFRYIDYFIQKTSLPELIVRRLSQFANIIDEVGDREMEKRQVDHEYKLTDWVGI